MYLTLSLLFLFLLFLLFKPLQPLPLLFSLFLLVDRSGLGIALDEVKAVFQRPGGLGRFQGTPPMGDPSLPLRDWLLLSLSFDLAG